MAAVDHWSYDIALSLEPGQSGGWSFGPYPFLGKTVLATVHPPYAPFDGFYRATFDTAMRVESTGSAQQFFDITIRNSGNRVMRHLFVALSLIRD